jgi:hypothetical protein
LESDFDMSIPILSVCLWHSCNSDTISILQLNLDMMLVKILVRLFGKSLVPISHTNTCSTST